jgi:hypothetical protein
MEALAAMALPHILRAAYSALTTAWTQYESVKEHKAQCEALLRKCTDLVVAVAKQSSLRSNDPMLVHVQSLDMYVIEGNLDPGSHLWPYVALVIPLWRQSRPCPRMVLRGGSSIKAKSGLQFPRQKVPFKLPAKSLVYAVLCFSVPLQ